VEENMSAPFLLNYKKKSTLENQQEVDATIFLLLMAISSQLFKWENLPDEIEPFQIEKLLFQYGNLVFFKLSDQYLILPASNTYDLNLYGEPIKVRPIGLNGVMFPERYIRDEWKFQGETASLVNKQNAVIIKNNQQSLSTWAFLSPFADRLIYTWESMGVNQAMAVRLNAFIHANKDNSGAIYHAINSILGSKSPIKVISERDNTLEGVSTVDLKIEYMPDKLWLEFINSLDLILTILGVNNKMAVEKKERLITDEIEVNNASIQLFRDTMYQYRKYGVEQINKFFGLDIKVFAAYESLETETPQLTGKEELPDANPTLEE
jgi:hypothetical protein